MRDIHRIKPILKKLKKYWYEYPDLRLGQIVYNLVAQHKGGIISSDCIFNIEDDDLLREIKKKLKNEGDNGGLLQSK